LKNVHIAFLRALRASQFIRQCTYQISTNNRGHYEITCKNVCKSYWSG